MADRPDDDELHEVDVDGRVWRFLRSGVGEVAAAQAAVRRRKETEAAPPRNPITGAKSYGEALLDLHHALKAALAYDEPRHPHQAKPKLPHEPERLDRIVEELIRQATARGWL